MERKKSNAFEAGLIDGYYDNNVPKSFFQVLALYAAESCIGHIPWAITFGDEEVKIATEVADKVYEWNKGFSLLFQFCITTNRRINTRIDESNNHCL